MTRWVLGLWVYILPIPLFILFGILWTYRTESAIFVTYILLVPLMYGYVMPFFATRVYGLWRFKGKMVLGTIFVHHGFKYAASLNLCWALATVSFTTTVSPGLGGYIAAILCTAFGYAFISWIHDIQILKRGLVEINNEPARARKSPEEVVTHYAPLSFFLIGACFASGGAAAYELFVVRRCATTKGILLVFSVGFALLFSIPALAYHYLDSRRVKTTSMRPGS